MIESFNKKELEEKIDRYVNGQLSPDEIDELWAELIQDDYHLDYMKSVANLKAVIDQRRKEKQARQQRQRWYYTAAAAIILILGVLGYMNFYAQPDAASIQPKASVELNYYRSEGGDLKNNGEPDIIQNAIQLANTGDVKKAISLLQGELKESSSPTWIAQLSLNIGSLHYNQGEFKKALTYYKKVVENKSEVDMLTLEKAYWYMGNAYLHMDNLTEARSTIKKAYELNGAYRRVSKSYLEALSD